MAAKALNKRGWDSRSASAEIAALAWSPDTRFLAVGTKYGVVQLWEQKGRLPLYRLPVSGSPAWNILFHPTSRYVLARGVEGVKMWDTVTGEQVLTGNYIPFAFMADGRRFAGGGTGGVGFLYRSHLGRAHRWLPRPDGCSRDPYLFPFCARSAPALWPRSRRNRRRCER
jgi:hypothetical protein